MDPRPFETISQSLRCVKLVINSINMDKNEEVVVCIQGVLAEMDLPPISKCIFTFIFIFKPALAHLCTNSKVKPSRCQYISQSVTLIGPNSKGFSNALQNVIQIHKLFSQHLKDGKLEKWKPTCILGYTFPINTFNTKGKKRLIYIH